MLMSNYNYIIFPRYCSSEENEDEDGDNTPKQRYKLRENKPITKRYTAPPLKTGCKLNLID